MRRGLGLAGLALVLVLVLLWLGGALDAPALWLEAAQRATQERLAGAIRALRGGEPGALAAFWGACLAYGVLHAAGPGHGKLVIGGYGVARRVPVGRLAGLALISSLAQAAVAVALVYGLVAALGLACGAVEGTAEDWLTPLGHAMIAGLGSGWSCAGSGAWGMITGTTTAMRTTTGTDRAAAMRMGPRSPRWSGSRAGATRRCWWRESRSGPVRARCSCWC